MRTTSHKLWFTSFVIKTSMNQSIAAAIEQVISAKEPAFFSASIVAISLFLFSSLLLARISSFVIINFSFMFKSVFVRTLLPSFLDNIIIPLPSSLVNNFAKFSLRFYVLHIKLVIFCKVYCAKKYKNGTFLHRFKKILKSFCFCCTIKIT